MSLLLASVDHDREYLLAPGDTKETDLGVLTVPDDASPGDTIGTHLGEAFRARRLRLPDCFHHFERTGAPMLPRDVGLVLGRTGIAAGDRVLDVGCGTGVLAAGLALAGAEVVSFERDPAFTSVARSNLHAAGVTDRVDIVAADATDVFGSSADGGDDPPESRDRADPAPFDAMTLDTADAPALIERAPDLLAPGGVLAAYVPFVEDARAAAEAAQAVGIDATTEETISREMDFDERGSRPSTAGVGHTGYLTFARAPRT